MLVAKKCDPALFKALRLSWFPIMTNCKLHISHSVQYLGAKFMCNI